MNVDTNKEIQEAEAFATAGDFLLWLIDNGFEHSGSDDDDTWGLAQTRLAELLLGAQA